jgi:hypothetical protein
MIQIIFEPDPSVEPGHQWLVLPNNMAGLALAQLLGGPLLFEQDDTIKVPHTADVDAQIVALINQLAHARFSAPALIQMTMEEAPELP